MRPGFDRHFVNSLLLKRGIGPKPWGCQIINEFEQFLKANYFLNDSMKMLIDLYDSRTVSQTSETTGRARVSGAAPSMLACIQPDRMIDSSVASIFKSGFFARTVLAVDDYVRGSIRYALGRQRTAVAQTPRPSRRPSRHGVRNGCLKPHEGRRSRKQWGKGNKEKGAGVWVHPVAQVKHASGASSRASGKKHTIPSVR